MTDNDLRDRANEILAITQKCTVFKGYSRTVDVVLVHRVQTDEMAEAVITLLDRLKKSQQCEECARGEHDCKEPGGGRIWIEFECECPECPE